MDNSNSDRCAVSRRAVMFQAASLLAVPAILRGSAAKAANPMLPDYYPAEYAQIVEASKSEGGAINVYSNISATNWRYLIEGFQAKFPWLQIKTNDLGNAEAFERYYNETSTGVFTADMLFNSAPRHWLKFIEGEHALIYDSPEAPHVPKWSTQFPGLFHLASEPMVMAYNKLLLPPELRPRGIRHLAEIIDAERSRFRQKVTTFTVDEAVGFDLSWKYVNEVDGGWEAMERILPEVRGDISSGSSVEKLSTGEALVGYFVSAPIMLPRLKGGLEQIIGWNLIEEGQPLALRTAAITHTSKHPNSAKLLVDYVQSHEGQVMAARGNMTPIREDLTEEEAPLNYARLAQKLGGDGGVVLCDYVDLPDSAQESEFIARWHAANRAGR